MSRDQTETSTGSGRHNDFRDGTAVHAPRIGSRPAAVVVEYNEACECTSADYVTYSRQIPRNCNHHNRSSSESPASDVVEIGVGLGGPFHTRPSYRMCV